MVDISCDIYEDINKLVWKVRRTENCTCISIFALILKLLTQTASMFSVKYFLVNISGQNNK